MEPRSPPPAEPWWTPFRRPSTWLVVVGFALLNVVLVGFELPEPWGVLAFATLLAVSTAVVTRARSPWAPMGVFAGVVATHAVLRLGGLPAFFALEAVLLLAAILTWRRRRPAAR